MRIFLASILFVGSALMATAADMTTTLPLRNPATITSSEAGNGTLRVQCDFNANFYAELGDGEALPSITRWVAISDGGSVTLLESSSTSPNKSAITIGAPIPVGGAQLVPVSFNPTASGNGSLMAVSSLTANLQVNSPSQPRLRRVIRQMMGDLLLNRDTPIRDQSNETAEGLYVYVIPNNNDVRNTLAPLITLRKQQGYDARELSVPDRESSEWVYDQLVNLNRQGTPIDYVLLAGDFGGQFSVPSMSRGVESDYYYALIEGRDNIPDAAVGRISYNSIQELQRVVSKIVNYETQFDAQNQAWLRKAAIATGHQASGFSTNLLGRWLRDEYLTNGYTGVDTLWYTMDGSVSRFMEDAFNDGKMFVNFRGWTGMDDWNIDRAGDLRNPKLPVALLLACNTGDYEGAGAGYTEALLRANGGAIGAIGIAGAQSRIGYNNALMAGYYRGIFEGNTYRLGWTVNRARLELDAVYGANAWELTLDHNSWLNLMGDPATILWLGTPRQVQIDAPEQVNAGLGEVQVRVTYADGGQAAAGVRVGLYRQGEIVTGAITGQDGRTTLKFAPRSVTQGNALITVSGNRIIQATDQVQMNRPARQIAVTSFSIIDDQVAPRNGNSNGAVNALETIQLSVQAVNFGAQPINPQIQFDLSSLNEYVEVVEGSVAHDQAINGNNQVQLTFLIRTLGSLPDRTRLPMRLRIRAGGDDWNSDFYLYGYAVKWELSQILAARRPSPGGEFSFGLLIRNGGSMPAGLTQALISCVEEDVEIVEDSTQLDSLDVEDFYSTGPSAYDISLSGDYAFASDIPFTVTFTSEEGYVGSFDFKIRTENPPPAELTGPDQYGYYAIDDRDQSSNLVPAWDWIEINPTRGGHGANTGILDEGEDDDESVYMALPFPFKYYGAEYRGVTICSNGWIAMGDQRAYVDFRNMPIGSPQGPKAQICPWWDDLYQPGANSSIYYYYDEEFHRFIVQWDGLRSYVGPQAVGPLATFQVILGDPAWYPNADGNGDILFQYSDVQADGHVDANSTPFATVGIGSPDDKGGLQVGYWNTWAPGSSVPSGGTAIRFITSRNQRYAIAKGTVLRTNNDPIAGAVVKSSRGGWAVTDELGQFRIPLIIADTPFRLTAMATGYNSSTSNEFNVRASDSTTVAFQLTAPEIAIEPGIVSDSLDGGGSSEHQLSITNSGNGELTYQIEISTHVEQGFNTFGVKTAIDRDDPDDVMQRLGHWSVTDSVNDNRILGVAFDGERFYVSGGANGSGENKVYLFGKNGFYAGVFPQLVHDNWGYHDLGWDGTNLYGGSGEFIYKFDLEGREVGRIANPVIPPRALTVTPGGDQIWVAGDEHPIYRLNSNGAVIRQYSHNLHPYGLAWHPADPDNAPLWIFSLDGETNLAVSKMDTSTGLITLVAQLDLEDGDRPGGCELTRSWDDHSWVFVAVIQNPHGDRIEMLQAGANLSWLACDRYSGVLGAGNSQDITISMESAGLEGGHYFADLIIGNNAIAGELRIPVQLYVQPNFAGVDEESPSEYQLSDVYPNPSNGRVVIKFQLPHSSHIRLGIYDQQGRLVEMLYEGEMSAGSHQRDFYREDTPSGLYLIKLSSSGISQTRKFVFLK